MMAYLTRGSMGGLFGTPQQQCERFNVLQSDVAFCLMMTDITKLPVDCIVNAATNSLLGGAGVDGAIHHAAGPELHRKCYLKPMAGRSHYSRCETGDAVLTKGPFGKNLLATDVIHTVGPIVYRANLKESSEELEDCIRNCLVLAEENKYKSIAFPAISCGIYNGIGDVWTATAARINIATCLEGLPALDSLKLIIFALPDLDMYQHWRAATLKILYDFPKDFPQQKQEVKSDKQLQQQQQKKDKKQREKEQAAKAIGKRPAPAVTSETEEQTGGVRDATEDASAAAAPAVPASGKEMKETVQSPFAEIQASLEKEITMVQVGKTYAQAVEGPRDNSPLPSSAAAATITADSTECGEIDSGSDVTAKEDSAHLSDVPLNSPLGEIKKQYGLKQGRGSDECPSMSDMLYF